MEEIKKLYLNTKDEDGNDFDPECPVDITWSEDDIYGFGIPYVLESDFKALQKENDRLQKLFDYLDKCFPVEIPIELLKGGE